MRGDRPGDSLGLRKNSKGAYDGAGMHSNSSRECAMNIKSYKMFTAFGLMALLAISGFAHANGLNNNEVEFTGTVESVIVNGEGLGTLFVTVNTIELRVIVNPKTIIQDESEELITMQDIAQRDLNKGLSVNIQGKFSSSGILANRIRILMQPEEEDDAGDSFLVRGHITEIQPSGEGTLISLLGINILINADTIIKKDGVVMTVADLDIGTKVAAIGHIEDGVWVAAQIHILTPGKKKGLLFFEGTVESYDDTAGVLQVAVTGSLEDNVTTVLVTPETQVLGVLEEGAYVLVIGVLNIDYTVTAREVRVLAPLEIKPDERKLTVGEEATFTVKLLETAAADVTVNLTMDPLDILEMPLGSVLIPAGEQTADFGVTALATGTTTITATIEGTDDTATALVKVGEVSEDDNERPEGDVRIYFSPDHVKVKQNQSREVVLHIQPPQPGDVEIVFTIVKANEEDEDIIAELTVRALGNGSAKYKVNLQSLGPIGTVSIIAALPEALGGAEAELLVEIKEK